MDKDNRIKWSASKFPDSEKIPLIESKGRPSPHAHIAQLQKAIGNQALSGLLRAQLQASGLHSGSSGLMGKTVQRKVRISNEERDAKYIDALDGSDHNDILGDVDIDLVKSTLRSWIELEEVMEFKSDAKAVQAAVETITGYRDVSSELEEQYLMDEYADVTETHRIVLFKLLGADGFQEMADSASLAVLTDLIDNHGLKFAEKLFTQLSLQRAKAALDNLEDFDNLVATLGAAKITNLLNNCSVAQLNTLFANMTAAHVDTLSLAVATELAQKNAGQIAGIEGEWARLRRWLTSTGELTNLLAIVAGGYTYAECGDISNMGATAQQARALQPHMADYATFDGFVTQAKRYGMDWAQMATVAGANAGQPLATLVGAIQNGALARHDKRTHGGFVNWIRAVDSLIADLNYTLNVSGAALLPHGSTTWERTVEVRTATAADGTPGVTVGTFVVHYHPGASDAKVGNVNASPRHIKPERGNAQSPHIYWPSIPGNILPFLPTRHDN